MKIAIVIIIVWGILAKVFHGFLIAADDGDQFDN